MKKFRWFFAVFSCLFTLSPALWADESVPDASAGSATAESPAQPTAAPEPLALPEVVVTANRLDTPLSEVAGSIDVITAKDLERKQAGTVREALQGVPGLDINRTGPTGEVTSLYLRGANPEHTLVLMDGVPLNDPVGAPGSYSYLDLLSLDGVRQIEVVRGPQSALNGSNAMGGLVNIVTREGGEEFAGSALLEGGAYGTSREAVRVEGGGSAGHFTLDASHYNTAGFPTLDSTLGGTLSNGNDNNTVFLRLGSAPVSNVEEKILARYNQSRTGLDAYNSSYALADDPNYFILQKQLVLGSSTRWKLFDGDWEQDLNLSFVDDNRAYTGVSNPYNTYFEQGNFDGQTAQIVWQNRFRPVRGEVIVVGLQGQQQWATEGDSNGWSDVSLSTSSEGVTANARMGSGFVESQTTVEDRLFLNAGGRWDNHSQFGDHFTYQTGAAYFLPEVSTKLKATLGTGFLAPSLYQLYNPNYGNVALLPETSTGFDAGFEQPFGGDFLTVGATYFHNDFNNLIYNNSTFPFRFANIHQAQSDGVESFAVFKGVRNLEARANYTYTDARDTASNLPLLRRPQHKGGVSVDYQWNGAEVGTSVFYVGARPDTDFTFSTVTLPSYFLVNLRASYRLSGSMKLFARVDNLFDQAYEEVYGYGTPRLSVYGGTNVSF